MSERVRHRVESADWSAVSHPHVIELVRQGCAEDPERVEREKGAQTRHLSEAYTLVRERARREE